MTGSMLRRALVGGLPALIAGLICAHHGQGYVGRAGADFHRRSARSPAVSSPRPASDARQEAAPRIEFDERAWDFGAIFQHEEASHVFKFRNTGNATLKIGKVKTTCGCTAALPAKTEIAAGDEGEIRVTFRAGTMRDHIVKHIYVDTNDPVQPRVSLDLTGLVKVELEVVPQGIYFGRLRVGEAMKRSIDLYSPEVPNFSILEVRSSHPALRVSKPVKPAGEPGRYRLNVQFGPVEEPGRYNETVTVRTDLPHAGQVVVRVYGKVVEPNDPADGD